MALAFGITGAFAQEATGLTSKKGEPILPESGDWAISVDAAPVLNYFGRFLSTAGATSPTWGYPGTPLAITGKMFKDEKTAYRAMVRLGFGSATNNNYVQQDAQADPTVTVKDTWKNSQHNIVLGAGIEMRKGKTRLQGYYGGMLMFGIGGMKDAYTYGNAFSKTNQTPNATSSWNPNISGPVVSRTLENKAGSTMMLGVRGFIGAEYFIFPKIAVGAEFGWGLGMTHTGDGSKKTESWDAANTTTKTTTMKTGGKGTFGIDTDINGSQMIPTGQLTLTMHF